MGKKSRRGRGCSPLLSLSGRTGILQTRRSRSAFGAAFAPKCSPSLQPSPSDDVKITKSRLQGRMGFFDTNGPGEGRRCPKENKCFYSSDIMLEMLRRRLVAICRRVSGILIAKTIHRHYSSGLKAIVTAVVVKSFKEAHDMITAKFK